MKLVIPIVLIGIAVGIFFVLIDPLYGEVQTLRTQVEQLSEAFDNAQQIQSTRDALLSKFNAIPQQDIERVRKMLPNDVDTVQLILETDQLASANGLGVRTIQAGGEESEGEERQERQPNAVRQQPYGSASLGLTLTGSYGAFRNFIEELDRSLRISDVASFSVRSGEQNFNEYTLELQTYWLQNPNR